MRLNPVRFLTLYLLAIVLLVCAIAAFAEDAILRVSWDTPTTYEDDEPLDPKNITGYDLYYTFDGAEENYAAWIPYDAETNVRSYDFAAKVAGEYCFKMVTVTRDDGKSERSDAVCFVLAAPEIPVKPHTPCDPPNVKVEQL